MLAKLKRVALWSFGFLLILLLLLGGGLLHLVGPSNFYRLVLDRGSHYDSMPPALPAELSNPAILVFSKTNGFRDDASIAAANAMFSELAKQRHWDAYFTENGAVFNPDQLARFKVTVWNSVSGDVLTAAQRTAFKNWIEHGGGFVGVHGAGGDPHYQWSWYVDNLIGAQFIGHPMWPQFQQATIRVEDTQHPAMAGLGLTWVRTDEWYSFKSSVRSKGYHVLATLDESTYSPKGLLRDDLHMGSDHPLIWTHCVGHGRVFYSALGHSPETYSEPAHRRMLANAVAWAAGLAGEDCEGTP